jgi:hypothetical protein
MAKSFTDVTPMKSDGKKSKEFNEFAQIEGLGPAMQRWLRESFEVYTIEDLAKLSVNRVLARLEDEEQAFCRHEIERWIKQAQSFVAEQTAWQTFATFVVSLQTRRIGGQTEQRTTAYFVEADRRAIWSGIECSGVYELMLEQLKHNFQLELEEIIPMEPVIENQPDPIADLPAKPGSVSPLEESASPAESNPATENQSGAIADSLSTLESAAPVENVESATSLDSQLPTASEPFTSEPLPATLAGAPAPKTITQPDLAAVRPPTAFKITQIKVLQPPQTENPITLDVNQQPSPMSLQKNQPFEMEVTFQLVGSAAIDLTREAIPYHVELFLRDRTTKETLPPYYAISPLIENDLTYTSLVTGAAPPQPGLYHLWIIVRLEKGYTGSGLFELPILQVV